MLQGIFEKLSGKDLWMRGQSVVSGRDLGEAYAEGP